ncbi:MAG: putative toxin-antitoxin system toxin component, PIN family [Saprospiraceae bacterium]|nr:putative toxin-antitoxin system toxin component, PIN family [Saprospiraceae bacterium]
MRKNIVLDTNTLLSAALSMESVSFKVVQKVYLHHQLVMSTPTWNELAGVINRAKFDKYFIEQSSRFVFLTAVVHNSLFVEPTETINDCRDPKDNKFLELAVAANATIIVTGDEDFTYFKSLSKYCHLKIRCFSRN